jgi:plastocyanin
VPEVYKGYKTIEIENAGTVEGVVLYKGPVPAAERIAVVKDHETCSRHPAERPRIQVNDQKLVAEAIVFLNIREGKATPERDEKATLDQSSCAFVPRVQVVQVGETLEIINSDPVLHNVQATQRMRTIFNHVQSQQGMRQDEKFDEVGLVSAQCQAHPWMKAWIYVLPHGYHAVTGKDGAFRLADVPPGEYELHVWQEHVGQQVQRVQVEAGQTARVEFELTAR